MEIWKIVLIFVALVIIALNIGVFVAEIELPNTPRDIYEGIDVNWFGAVVLYLLIIMLLPIIYLCMFIYFIFTAGRKN